MWTKHILKENVGYWIEDAFISVNAAAEDEDWEQK